VACCTHHPGSIISSGGTRSQDVLTDAFPQAQTSLKDMTTMTIKGVLGAFLCAALAGGQFRIGVVRSFASTRGDQQAFGDGLLSLNELLARANLATLEVIDQLSNVVAEERYVQDSNVLLPAIPMAAIRGAGRGGVASAITPTGTAKHRELRADFLVVKSTPDVWQPFRDVFEVDGVPIRDRQARLAKLFLDNKGDAEARAAEIAAESARYNLGAVERTINNPIFALIFLQPETQSRFRFSEGKGDKSDRLVGPNVRVVAYVEEARPTVIRGQPGQDMPAFGRFWIDERTGRVLKTELRVEQKGVRASLSTEFRVDDRLGILVPAELHESYELADSHVTGIATYSRYRRFDVQASEDIVTPSPDQAPPTP